MTSGAHDDGELGEVFLKLGKQGSTLAGVMDAFSIAVSIGLQYGVPLETYVSKFTNLRFEPAGLTDDPDVRMSQSIMDYIFRRLALDYLTFEERSQLGIYSAEERQRHLETGSYEPLVEETGSASELVEAESPVEQGRQARVETTASSQPRFRHARFARCSTTNYRPRADNGTRPAPYCVVAAQERPRHGARPPEAGFEAPLRSAPQTPGVAPLRTYSCACASIARAVVLVNSSICLIWVSMALKPDSTFLARSSTAISASLFSSCASA